MQMMVLKNRWQPPLTMSKQEKRAPKEEKLVGRVKHLLQIAAALELLERTLSNR